MYLITGKIVVKETGAGIPNLVVRAFDIDVVSGKSKIASFFSSGDQQVDQLLPYDSLGSVLTSDDGVFSLEFEEADFTLSDKELRPDIFIMIEAPDDVLSENNADTVNRVMHTSKAIRLKSGKTESYFIRIEESVLQKYDLSSFSAKSELKRLKLKTETNKMLFAEIQKTRIEHEQKIDVAFEGFNVDNQKTMPSTFVPLDELGEVLADKQDAIISEVAKSLNEKTESRIYSALLGERELKKAGAWDNDAPANKIVNRAVGINLLHPSPSLQAAKRMCLREINEGDITSNSSHPPLNEENQQPTTVTNEGQTRISREDILRDVQEQISAANSPEEAFSYQSLLEDRAGVRQICDSLNSLSICGGPADVTSFHDFKTVQMAFEQIWTEALDSKLETDARELYGEIVRLEEGYSEVETNLRVDDDGLTIGWPVNSQGVATPPRINTVRDLQRFIRQFSSASTPIPQHIRRLAEKLDQRLSESYKFRIFAPDSINYGLVYTFRQKWEPKSYQVGRLVSSIPLAPKESKKYSSKLTKVLTRNQKRMDDQEYKSHSESSATARAESEIINKAQNKTSFNLTAGASYSAGVISAEMRTQFGTESENLSSETKKNFRESVVKAANDFRKQNKVELEFSEKSEMETTSSGEIINPNDEITVTYLFYELQRQYDISEELYKIEPVIFVANEVPMPDEIDFDWLVANSWILQKVILDPMYLSAIYYLSESGISGTMTLDVLRRNLDKQALLVETLTSTLARKNDQLSSSFELLRRIIIRDRSLGLNEDQMRNSASTLMSILNPIGSIISAFTAAANEEERLKRLKEATNMSMERLEKEKTEFSEKLINEFSQLQSLTAQYVDELKRMLDKEHSITQLRIHVKENILYYMQAIWDHEPSDQRFFRLFDKEVDWFEIPEETVEMTIRERDPFGRYRVEIPTDESCVRVKKKLVEIADLDNVLGYKGNYMIFATKKRNQLHQYMMRSYIDLATGQLADSDNLGNLTTQELIDYLRCLRTKNTTAYEREKDRVIRMINDKLLHPRTEKERIIVPTDSLFIEALPGVHPVLENFKLAHRSIDVKKVQAEVRRMELENIRYAARILSDQLEDPDFDKQTLVRGLDADGTDISD
ncbi:MAG: hypothetical protein QE487_15405 [Fluviicola sp.]|nr:hypothetical protein [Fluviicola sp.]